MSANAPADARQPERPPTSASDAIPVCENTPGNSPTDRRGAPAPRQRGQRTLLLLIAVCVAPVIASYLAFYFLPPDGRTNYGDLVDPQRDVTAMPVAVLRGHRAAPMANGGKLGSTPAAVSRETGSLADWSGRWVMIAATSGDCDEACAEKLYKMRQVRLTQGKNRDRVERLWLITDDAAPDARIVAGYDVDGYDGMTVARISPEKLRELFPPASGQQAGDHIWLVDPLGHLMMRFPVDADPSRMKKDFIKLLKASRIG